MRGDESLCLPDRLESPHPSLPHSGRHAGLLGPIVRLLVSDMNGFRNHFTVSNWIATQLVRHDLPGFATVTSQQALEKALGGRPVPLRLEIHVYDFAVLIYDSPKVLLLAVDLYEDFVDVEGVAVASVLAL